ncbi:MAG: proline dehydrogenase family protein [Candidatus Electryonea clarkiae]|nr:proline dehydrogenase family protein [Candidatus Electryonea clarkiae]MDP8286059.1 proline dehydrogenase family protein [Candidatus Electryonea clarkiae]
MSLLDTLVVTTLPLVPKSIVRRFAGPYIAGESLNDAIEAVKKLNRQGISTTIDVLGESVTQPEKAQQYVSNYLKVLDAIDQHDLDSNISIKPTQFGLGIDTDLCRDNFIKLMDKLRKYDNFVRIDMEDSPFTTLTLDLHESISAEYSKSGIVIQAYLRRTIKDLEERLIPGKANIRLCKGIYIEPHDLAYKDTDVVRKNFNLLLEKALKAGLYVGIATHDEILVWDAMRIIEKLDLSPDQYEFQMLLGVTESLRRQIVLEGHKMRVYVPFGKDWYAYSTRRLKENPKIAGYVFKDIFNLK